MWRWGIVVLAGCGRISFDSTAVDAPLPMSDAQPADALPIDAPPIDAMIDAPLACTDGQARVVVGTSCYMLYTGPLDYADASTDCTSRGYHLATLTSATENTMVSAIVPTEAWIGGNDIAVEGTFAWVTGEPFVFTAWTAGEPNNAMNEDCVETRNVMTWNDDICTDPEAYLCERD